MARSSSTGHPAGSSPTGLAIQTAKLTRAWRERIATLSTFLIGILFIILSARVSPHQIGEIGWVSLAFIGVLVFVGRPLAVGLSTLGSALPMRERAFIAWMAPRGIVAAATSSTFALGLTQAGVGGGAQDLIPITFIVIVATALIYGLSGGPVARALGVASTGPGGVLLLGATPVGRAIGRALQDRGLTVLVWTGGRRVRPGRQGRRAQRLPRQSHRGCERGCSVRARRARIRARRRCR